LTTLGTKRATPLFFNQWKKKKGRKKREKEREKRKKGVRETLKRDRGYV